MAPFSPGMFAWAQMRSSRTSSMYGDVFGRSTRYNRVIGRLRTLRELLDALIRRCEVPVDADSVIWPAHQALLDLDEMIALRQSLSMGHGIVRVATLDLEIEYLQGHHAHLAAIITSTVNECCDPVTSSAPTAPTTQAPSSHTSVTAAPGGHDGQGR
jgi:hypothetical protein